MEFNTADIASVENFAELDYIIRRINIYLIIESDSQRTFDTPV